MFKNRNLGSFFFLFYKQNKISYDGGLSPESVLFAVPENLPAAAVAQQASPCASTESVPLLSLWVGVPFQCIRSFLRNFVIDVFHSFSFSVGSVCWLSCISPACRRMHKCWKDSLSCIMKEEKFQGRNLLATVSIPALYLALQAPTASEW